MRNCTLTTRPNADLRESYTHVFWTFLYDGGFIVLLMILPRYGGTNETAPMARTRQTKPLETVRSEDPQKRLPRRLTR